MTNQKPPTAEKDGNMNITVNGVEYAPVNKNGNIEIVILQRGWVMIGRFVRQGSDCELFDAQVIRNWGTKKGLGEIAKGGPTKDTVLDPCNGVVRFDYLTVVARIECSEEAWKNEL